MSVARTIVLAHHPVGGGRSSLAPERARPGQGGAARRVPVGATLRYLAPAMEFLAILIVVAVGFFWHFQMRAREQCLDLARHVCDEMGVELLDDTVWLNHMSLRRDREEHLRIRRIYEFQYLDPLREIHPGLVILLGREVESVVTAGEGTLH
ncbi:MAG: DUF3301 domain-containing protein [Magnetococcales bacterium]|nr:DUF3301 domain-containing protein [Magnetococcales bacterium]